MAVEIEVENITQYLEGWEPQDFLSRKYKSQPALPIRGGWGYSQADAVVIDKAHPAAANFRPFNGVEVEYIFARLRMYEELIGCRPVEKRHAGTEISMKKQFLRDGENGKVYDVVEFDITALPIESWDELKAEWEGPNGADSPDFDRKDHSRRRAAATVHYVGEYWFEISSFFGKYDDDEDAEMTGSRK